MSPVFYSVRSLSPRWQYWMGLNPLTPVIENLRLIVFSGAMPNWGDWLMDVGVACAIALFGAWVFRMTRDGFADVL
jgi:lipopolysaccharide transport system permease protein